MKLLAIRNFDEQDPLPGLGPKVEPASTPAPGPASVPGKPGLIRHPDGKLETSIPPPPPPETPVLDYTLVGGQTGQSSSFGPAIDALLATKPAEPAEPRPAFAVGDLVKVLSCERYGSDILEMERLVGTQQTVHAVSGPDVRLRDPRGCGGWWFHASELELAEREKPIAPVRNTPAAWTVRPGNKYRYFAPSGKVEEVSVDTVPPLSSWALVRFQSGSLAWVRISYLG
jgi:hypothetical protein